MRAHAVELAGGVPSDQPVWLGEYEVLTPIGSGGMGRVYLARSHRAHGVRRLVAVKVLSSALRHDPAAWDMLMDEARIGARIRHPNCVASHELAEQDGVPYLVMDYVNGPSLSVLTRRAEALSSRVLFAVMLDALAGLHAAHETCDDFGNRIGLVHRDVSPGNILVDVSGNSFVTDFGISKAEERVTSTQHGVYKGKIRYLSPEQLTNPAAVDRRSDVFSAGIVLFEALTRTALFRHPDSVTATMQNVLHREVPRPSELRQDIPPALDALLLRSLERDPDARFQNVEEMSLALAQAADAMEGVASRNEVRDLVKDVWRDELRRRAEVCRLQALSGAISLTGSGSFTPQTAPVRLQPSAPDGRESRLWPLAVVLGMVVAGALTGLLIPWGKTDDGVVVAPLSPAKPRVLPNALDRRAAGVRGSQTENPVARETSTLGDEGGLGEEAAAPPTLDAVVVQPTAIRPEEAPVRSHSDRRSTQSHSTRRRARMSVVREPIRSRPRQEIRDVESNPYTRSE